MIIILLFDHGTPAVAKSWNQESNIQALPFVTLCQPIRNMVAMQSDLQICWNWSFCTHSACDSVSSLRWIVDIPPTEHFSVGVFISSLVAWAKVHWLCLQKGEKAAQQIAWPKMYRLPSLKLKYRLKIDLPKRTFYLHTYPSSGARLGEGTSDHMAVHESQLNGWLPIIDLTEVVLPIITSFPIEGGESSQIARVFRWALDGICHANCHLESCSEVPFPGFKRPGIFWIMIMG